MIDAGLSVPRGASQIVPVLLGENERAILVAQSLQAQGFDVRAIRPPTVPAGTARLRITVNVGLTDETLDRFATALAGIENLELKTQKEYALDLVLLGSEF